MTPHVCPRCQGIETAAIGCYPCGGTGLVWENERLPLQQWMKDFCRPPSVPWYDPNITWVTTNNTDTNDHIAPYSITTLAGGADNPCSFTTTTLPGKGYTIPLFVVPSSSQDAMDEAAYWLKAEADKIINGYLARHPINFELAV